MINGNLNFDKPISSEPEDQKAHFVVQFVFNEVIFGHIWFAKSLNDLITGSAERDTERKANRWVIYYNHPQFVLFVTITTDKFKPVPTMQLCVPLPIQFGVRIPEVLVPVTKAVGPMRFEKGSSKINKL